MKIGIIGAGNIGANLAKLFAIAGHQIRIANSRGKDSLASIISEINHANVQAVDAPAEAAAFGEVVVEAIPYKSVFNLPAKELKGKILITAANYYPTRDGHIDLEGHTQSKFLASKFPETKVVKAFNTIYFTHLAKRGDVNKLMEERRVIPVSANDEEAKKVVMQLVEQIGFAPLDFGKLEEVSVWVIKVECLLNPLLAECCARAWRAHLQ